MVLWQPQANNSEPYKKQTLVQILKGIFDLSFDKECMRINDLFIMHGKIESAKSGQSVIN